MSHAVLHTRLLAAWCAGALVLHAAAATLPAAAPAPAPPHSAAAADQTRVKEVEHVPWNPALSRSAQSRAIDGLDVAIDGDAGDPQGTASARTPPPLSVNQDYRHEEDEGQTAAAGIRKGRDKEADFEAIAQEHIRLRR